MHALITGASAGIGQATKQLLESAGWGITDLSRRTYPSTDVTNRRELDDYLDSIVNKDFDALVYCAGHVDVGPIEEVGDQTWDYHVEVNLTAAFRLMRWFINESSAKNKAIIFVASTAALRSSPEWIPYSATKAGLVNLAISAGAELADKGVRVYCVAPGRCATDLRRKLAPDEDPATIMQPNEVATVIETLLHDVAGNLAGQVIEVKKR